MPWQSEASLSLVIYYIRVCEVSDCQSTKSRNFQVLLTNKWFCTRIINNFLHRYKFWNDDPDVSLRFKIQDGRNSEMEPAYTETKASILRRRNTLAKMMQQEYGGPHGISGRLLAKSRHWSLTDLPRSHIDEENRPPYNIKR